MNRLTTSPSCGICGRDLHARWLAASLVRMRAEWARMMATGMCDDRQSDRMEAALEFEASINELALVRYCGAAWSHHRPPRIHPVLTQARRRLRVADARCVRLKMWAGSRPDYRGEHA